MPTTQSAEPQSRDNQWHLDKKVPITLIITLLTYGVAGLWAFADVKKDVEVIKIQIIGQHDRNDRQERSAQEAMTLIRGQLEKMDMKLDRALERGSK